jgi:NAD(P)-dependent dehydrogenase (short-subunit alcohol dehydrogenase family)
MRTVLVTGCTSGFGKLLVEMFLQNGDQVIATGRKLTSRSEILTDARNKFGKRLLELDLDVADSAQRAQVIAKLTSLDILINNAGYGLSGALEDLSENQIREQMEVNFFGTVFMTQGCLPLLRKSHGKIFNFSSAFGFVGFPLTSLYCASKFAIEGFSESLSHELAPHHVQVCLIEPGAYRTSFGSKMLWGERSLDPQSPYFLQTSNYQRLQDQLKTRENPPNPQDVADKIFHLANGKSLPMRVRCGKDAQATHFMKLFTPAQTFHQMSGRLYKKMFSKEAN